MTTVDIPEAYVQTDNHGVTSINTRAFAADMAPRLDGTIANEGIDHDRARIHVGDLCIAFHTIWNKPGRLEASCWLHTLDLPRDLYPTDKARFHPIEFSVSRSMSSLAADIRNRLILPSARVVKIYREAEAKHKADKLALIRIERELREIGGLSVNPGREGYSLTIYDGRGISISATAYAYGGITIDRLGSLTLDQFKAILAIIKEPRT